MNKIKSLSILAITAAIFTCFAYTADQNNKLSATEKSQGWKLLFDGKIGRVHV